MSMQDPLADMLTRIRNALQAKHTQVALPSSKLKETFFDGPDEVSTLHLVCAFAANANAMNEITRQNLFMPQS